MSGWSRGWIPRFEGFRQRFRPNFTVRRLGRPHVMLVSCGSLTAVCFVPGLMEFLLSGQVPFVLLCQFNADRLHYTLEERDRVGRIAERAGRCVFVSSENLELARRQLARPLENSVVVPNLIRITADGPMPLPPAREVVKMACVARFETVWKGQDRLIALLGQSPWRKRPWELSLYGHGPDRAHLERCVENHGLTGKVFFRGQVSDIKKIWEQNHLLVLPSAGEGMSLAMLEAMMCGRPVVIPDVGGVKEAVKDGISGFVALSNQPDDLGAALERAWAGRNRWVECGRRGFELARGLHSSQPAKTLRDVLHEVAMGKRHG